MVTMQIDDYIKDFLVKNNLPVQQYHYVDDFINFIVQDKALFSAVIPVLPTRKLESGRFSLLDITLKRESTLLLLLVKEMFKHFELTINDKAFVYFTVSKTLQRPLSEQDRICYQEIKELLAPPLYAIDQFNDYAFLASEYGIRLEIEEKFLRKPLVEQFIMALLSDSISRIEVRVQQITKEELLELLTFQPLKLPLSIHSFRGLNIVLNEGENAFDLLLRRNYINSLSYLINLAQEKGLSEFVQNWLNENSHAVLLMDLAKFAGIVKKIERAPPRDVYILNFSLKAKHAPDTKEDRRNLKDLLESFIKKQIVNQPEVTEKQTHRLVYSFKLKEEFYCLYSTGTPSIYANYVLEHRNKFYPVLHPINAAFKPANFYLMFNGNALEESSLQKEDPAHPISYWDNWESHQFMRSNYPQIIHPAIKQAVDAIALLLQGNTPRIIDLCGGTGKVAERILQTQKANYTLLENNPASVEEARKILKDKAGVVETDVLNEPTFFSDEKKTIPIEESSVDITIASGALAAKVLPSKAAALEVLNKIHRYLKSGGYLILSSWSASYINASDLKERGFVVINMTLPGLDQLFYIAKKN